MLGGRQLLAMTNSQTNGHSVEAKGPCYTVNGHTQQTGRPLLVKIPGLESELQRCASITNELVIAWDEGELIYFSLLRQGFSV